MTRKEAREAAFVLIFEKEMNDSPLEELIELYEQNSDTLLDEYVKYVTYGVFEHLDYIDGIISKYAVSWNIKRISKASLAVLRLAVFEMKYYDEIPVSVSINEAVELSKKYATKEDASFVNGILSSAAKENDE